MKKFVTEEKLCRAFNVLVIALFAMLFYYSFGMTWENNLDLMAEYVYPYADSLLGNTLGLLGALAAGVLLHYLIQRSRIKINMNPVALVVCLLAGAFSIYWVGASSTAPFADQLHVCTHAEAFENGDFSGLGRGQYVGICPHQLGLITFIRLLYKIFGMGNYRAFQYISALMVPVLIYSGYQIVKRISKDNITAEGYYLLLMMTCMPMYFYVPYVYGEIISTALGMFATWMLLWTMDKFSWLKLALMSVALGAAVQFRTNTLIIAIAFAIVLLIKLLSERKWQTVVTLVGVFFGIVLLQLYINVTYSKLIPDDSQGMPASSYIAMGVNEINGMAGWNDYYNQQVFRDNDCNAKMASDASWEHVKTFLEVCRTNPEYATDFYYRKICSQWNAPMYQSIAMNNHFDGDKDAFAVEVYFGDLRLPIERAMNLQQLVVYGGVLVLLFLVSRRWKQIDNYVLLIAILGGFLFSILWEAKSRYVFPYYVLMIPYAAMGIYELINCLRRRYRKDAALKE